MPQNLPLFPSKAASLGNNAPNQPLFPSEAAGGCVIMWFYSPVYGGLLAIICVEDTLIYWPRRSRGQYQCVRDQIIDNSPP